VDLHRASGGNPLYLHALAQAARSAGAEPSGWTEAGALETIGRSVFDRLEAAPAETLELARAVAVLGTAVELANAAQLAGIGLDDAAKLAHRLVELDILEEGERLGFVHPVVREVIYEELGGARRRVMHLDAARVLRDADAPAERIAAQLLRAERSREPWVVDALRGAAQEATARAAHAQSATYLGRAVDAANADERPQIMRELAAAEHRAGRVDAISHQQLAMESSQGRERADAALELSAYLMAAERDRDALAAADDALAYAEGDQRPRLIAFAAAFAQAGVFDAADARMEALEALAAESESLAPPASTVLAVCRFARNDRSMIEQLDREMRDVIEGRARSLELWFYAAWALMACEREATVIEFARALREKAAARGSVTGLAMANSALAAAALRLGDLVAAEAHGHAALEASTRAPVSRQYVQLSCGVTLVTLLEQDGPPEDLAPVLGLVDEDTCTFPHVLPLWARARVRLAQGDTAGAIQDLRRCAERCLPGGIVDTGWAPWRSDLALALSRASEPGDEPPALIDEELRLATESGANRARGIALRARGLLVGGDDGVELLSEAVDVLADTSARLEHVRAQVDFGAALRRRRNRQLARAPLSEALETSLRLGARALAARAHEELTASGARPRNPYRRGVDSLTVSERRVARIAAAGRTNREIAEELYVSLKTVESHLRSVYSKLGIAGRPELAEALSGEIDTSMDEPRSTARAS
jgi:DNA-binding NarL/FixJ family response regulator